MAGPRSRARRTEEIGFPAKDLLLAPFYFTTGSPGILDIFLADSKGTFQPVNRRGEPAGRPIALSCPTPEPKVPLFPELVTG